MTKSEFFEKINLDENTHVISDADTYQRSRAFNSHIDDVFFSYSPLGIWLTPQAVNFSPRHSFRGFTPVFVPRLTRSIYTATHAEYIAARIEPYKKLWKRQLSAYKKTAEFRAIKHEIAAFDLAMEAGLEHDFDATSGRGDHFNTGVFDIVRKKRDLKNYHTAGMLVLAKEGRTRVYAKSSQWRSSERTDTYLIGRNENGNPFRHQVPNTITSVAAAWEWIWGGADIEARQGDVGIAPSSFKHVSGEDDDIDVIGGHSSHRFIGEVYRNGSIHVRNGFLYHETDQHPALYIGNEWKRIVVGRRSQVGLSSRD